MGHRALIAYERPDGLYNCHYAHWGARNLRLHREITPERPFGGPDASPWALELFEALVADVPDPDLEGYLSEPEPPRTTVDPVPRARGLSLEAIVTGQLDFLHHEAFYVVDGDFEVTAYRTLWFGLQYEAETVTDGETIGNGALRRIRWQDGEPVGDEYVLGEFSGLKQVVADLVDRDVFGHAAGIEYMAERLRAWVADPAELVIYNHSEGA